MKFEKKIIYLVLKPDDSYILMISALVWLKKRHTRTTHAILAIDIVTLIYGLFNLVQGSYCLFLHHKGNLDIYLRLNDDS